MCGFVIIATDFYLLWSFLCHKRVELWREPSKSLGISIVGGRGMGSRLSNGEVMRGIFIKHILEDSPAGKNGTLKTGDRIVEVLSECLLLQFPWHLRSHWDGCVVG